jgi:hypothetical protein
MLPTFMVAVLWVIQSHTCNPTELEELRININLDGTSSNSQDYWNTGLFLEQDTVAETQR